MTSATSDDPQYDPPNGSPLGTASQGAAPLRRSVEKCDVAQPDYKAKQITRLLQMYRLLQSRRSFDAEMLATQLDVARRTVFRQLRVLRQAGIPVRYSRKTRSYCIDRSYFMPAIQLEEDELLAYAIHANQDSLRIAPGPESAIRANAKIEAAIRCSNDGRLRTLIASIEVHTQPISESRQIADLFVKLSGAIVENRVVGVRYDDNAISTRHDNVKPYRLAFLFDAWYVVGWSELFGAVRLLRLDQIEELIARDRFFLPPVDFSMEAYLGYAWRIDAESAREHVIIEFDPEVAEAVESVSWHKTQQTRRQLDGSLIFEATVNGLEEIEPWILSYGRFAKVLEPTSLRRQVANSALAMLRSHQLQD